MNQATSSRMPTSLDDVLALMQADRKAVDDLSMRPLVHLLSARAAGYRGADHHKLAAIIEFIHTSTLLHDDVVDESARRRGQVAAHEVWGNAASVLVGDFLYSRSFQLMVELDRMPVMTILADITSMLSDGEELQLMQLGNPDLNIAASFQIISDKKVN